MNRILKPTIFKSAVVAFGLLLSVMSFAETKVAVVDLEAAVVASNIWKQAESALMSKMKSDETKLKKLESEVFAYIQRYEKEKDVMAQKDKVDLEYNIRTKQAEAQEIIAKNQKMQQEGIQSAMTKLRPKLQGIIDGIVKEKQLDVVLNKQAVYYSSESLDVTSEVTKRLNQ